jgi:hypothetical protein
MFQGLMGSGAEPEPVAVVTPAICVQLLQAVPSNSSLSAIEKDVRDKALNYMASVFDEDARMRARPPASDDNSDISQPPANRRRTR